MTRRPRNLLTWLSLLLCVGTVGLWTGSQFFCAFLGYSYAASDRAYHVWRTSCYTGLASVTLDVFSFPQDQPGAFAAAARTGELAPGLKASILRYEPAHESQWRTESRWKPGTPYYSRFADPTPTNLGGTPGAVLDRWTVRVPLWCFAALFAVPPACALARRRRHTRRAHRARCSNCDYDLRATPDRCPECGAPA